MKRLELQIHGQVQGVAFRWSAQREAQALGLTGWVRNRVDGTVLLVAEGDSGSLGQLLTWAEQGPVHARVDLVDADWAEATGDFATFEVTG